MAARAPIPRKLRAQVWRAMFTVTPAGAQSAPVCPMDGYCFACDSTVSFDSLHGQWHCGHIVADANGGPTELDNLKPLCRSCNLKMGTMNMYEYILNNSPGKTNPGKARLKILARDGRDHEKIGQALEIAELVELTEQRLEALAEAHAITEKAAAAFRRKVRSKRGGVEGRATTMEEVQALCRKHDLSLTGPST